MPRQREFDAERALADAMELFWRRGYDGTSLDDLVAHTGVARAGLYAAFGDKHALYLKALDRYVAERNLAMAQLLRETPSGVDAVRTLLERYASDALGRSPKGCLVVNSALLLAATDPDVRMRIARSWDAMVAAISGALERAQRAGEIPPDHDPTELAHFVLVVLQGLRAMARTRPRPAFVRDAVTRAVASLTG